MRNADYWCVEDGGTALLCGDRVRNTLIAPNITFNRFGKVNVVEMLSCMLWYPNL